MDSDQVLPEGEGIVHSQEDVGLEVSLRCRWSCLRSWGVCGFAAGEREREGMLSHFQEEFLFQKVFTQHLPCARRYFWC